MPDLALSPAGLLLATAMSVTNVFTDVARKRALDGRELIPATFWMRVAVTVCFGVALLWQILRGTPVEIRDGGALFGIEAMRLSPIPTFLVYLAIDVGLIACVMWLYFRALQVSPLSMCVPVPGVHAGVPDSQRVCLPGRTAFAAQTPGRGADRGGVAGDAPATVRGGLERALQSGDSRKGQPLHAGGVVPLFASPTRWTRSWS